MSKGPFPASIRKKWGYQEFTHGVTSLTRCGCDARTIRPAAGAVAAPSQPLRRVGAEPALRRGSVGKVTGEQRIAPVESDLSTWIFTGWRHSQLVEEPTSCQDEIAVTTCGVPQWLYRKGCFLSRSS